MNYVIAIVLIYLYAAIPFSYLIGKVIYKKNILEEGSKNPGGSNLGRVCGKWAFVLGFIMDASKGAFVVILCTYLQLQPSWFIFFALLGHGRSVFLKFKGGKGVATACGFVLAYTFWAAIFALTIFVIVLYLKKYVSLASLVAIGAYLIYSIIYQSIDYILLISILYIIVIYLHRENIKKIKNKTENKISWM